MNTQIEDVQKSVRHIQCVTLRILLTLFLDTLGM